MIRISDKSQCCGCTACQSICPHDAIVMKEDGLGFKYPEVDMKLCVDCGLCEKVCDFSARTPVEVPDSFTLSCHAVRHKDETVLARRQSGGAFTSLSEVVLDDGGVVYGAGFNDDFSVSHKRAVSSDERNAMRGSKYVQRDLSGVSGRGR